MPMYKVLRLFATTDATGKISGKPGDIIEITSDSTVERLINLGLIEKPKKTRKKKQANNNEVNK